MVGFAQVQYNVNFCDLPTFYSNAVRYFPSVLWKISFKLVTITRVKSAEILMTFSEHFRNAKDEDVFTFNSGSIWDSESFVEAIPKVKNWNRILSTITESRRSELGPFAIQLANNYHDSGLEVAMFVKLERWSWDFEKCTQVMALLNETLPLDGYLYCKSIRCLIIKKKGTDKIMEIHSSFDEDDEDESPVYTNCTTRFMFDFDDGFICTDRKRQRPRELTLAFQEWVKNKRVGEVLPLSLHNCRNAVITVFLISKRYAQPLNYMFQIIAKKLWETREEEEWENATP